MAVEVIEIKDANGVTQRVYVDKIGTDNVQVVKLGYGNDDALTLASSTNPMPVNVVAGSAAGTEYTEGNSDPSITGTAVLWEDAADTLWTVSIDKPMPVNVVAGAASGVEYTEGAIDATITGKAMLWEDVGDTIRTVSAATPLPITATGSVGVSAGENHIGEVGGRTRVITPVTTVSLTAYAAGDTIAGKLTLTNAVRIVSGSGVLQTLTVIDADNEKAAFDVYLFDSNPTGTYTDNAVPTVASVDLAKVIGVIPVLNTDYHTIASDAVAMPTFQPIAFTANGSQNIYAVCIARGTPTYTATNDLTLRFSVLQD
jgi:hypothetical protein